MTSVYIKLVIAGSRTIADIAAKAPKQAVPVAVGVIKKGIDDGEEYLTLEDVPAKYRAEVREQLEADGYHIS